MSHAGWGISNEKIVNCLVEKADEDIKKNCWHFSF